MLFQENYRGQGRNGGPWPPETTRGRIKALAGRRCLWSIGENHEKTDLVPGIIWIFGIGCYDSLHWRPTFLAGVCLKPAVSSSIEHKTRRRHAGACRVIHVRGLLKLSTSRRSNDQAGKDSASAWRGDHRAG